MGCYIDGCGESMRAIGNFFHLRFMTSLAVSIWYFSGLDNLSWQIVWARIWLGLQFIIEDSSSQIPQNNKHFIISFMVSEALSEILSRSSRLTKRSEAYLSSTNSRRQLQLTRNVNKLHNANPQFPNSFPIQLLPFRWNASRRQTEIKISFNSRFYFQTRDEMKKEIVKRQIKSKVK